MATKELTEILQTAGAAGDASIGLSADGGLVRRDSVPFDADGGANNSSDTDFFVGVSVSGDARMFNAIPYIKDDTAATPAVGDLVIGQGSDGSAKQFTVASLAVTLEGESFGTAAFVNTGSGAAEVPTNADLGSAAFANTGSGTAEVSLGIKKKGNSFTRFESVGSVTIAAHDIVLFNDGESALILNRDTDLIIECSIADAYNISTLTTTGNTLDVSPLGDILLTGIAISDNGLFLSVSGNYECYQYSMSSAFDITTATDTGKRTGTATAAAGIEYANSGDLLLLCEGSRVVSYSLSTAYDISTATATGSTYDSSATTTGVRLSSDGSSAYVLSPAGTCKYLALNSAFVLTNGGVSERASFDMDVGFSNPYGLFVHPLSYAIYSSNTTGIQQFNTSLVYGL